MEKEVYAQRYAQKITSNPDLEVMLYDAYLAGMRMQERLEFIDDVE